MWWYETKLVSERRDIIVFSLKWLQESESPEFPTKLTAEFGYDAEIMNEKPVSFSVLFRVAPTFVSKKVHFVLQHLSKGWWWKLFLRSESLVRQGGKELLLFYLLSFTLRILTLSIQIWARCEIKVFYFIVSPIIFYFLKVNKVKDNLLT